MCIYTEHSACVVVGVCLFYFTFLSLHTESVCGYKGMRTRRGFCYPNPKVNMCRENKIVKRRRDDFPGVGDHRKRSRLSPGVTGHHPDLFDSLPDDLVVSILCKLTSSAASPADFVNVLIT